MECRGQSACELRIREQRILPALDGLIFRHAYDAIDIIYKRLQADCEAADITDIIRALHGVVAEAIATAPARAEIESTFAALLKFVQTLDDEESRAMREGLDEESLALFELLLKPGLGKPDIQRIRKIAAELLRRFRRLSMPPDPLFVHVLRRVSDACSVDHLGLFHHVRF